MSSSEYMRVVPEAMPLKVYGFKRVSKMELEDIIHRLQRPTHTQETQHNSSELWQSARYPPRAPFTVCRRQQVAHQDQSRATSPSRPPMGDRMMQKVVRRLQRPTISTMAAEGTIAPNYELDFAAGQPLSQRPKTAEDQEKLLERMQRPTTASRRKLFGHLQCLLCEDLARSSVHETMKRIQRNEGASHHTHRRATTATPTSGLTSGVTGSSSAEVTANNTSRARSATHASGGGRPVCPRLPSGSSANRVRIMSPTDLPLISGLSRSGKVDDITARLHPAMTSPGMTSRPVSSVVRTPAATPVAVYG